MNSSQSGSSHARAAARSQRNLTEEVPPPVSAEAHRLSKIAEALEERRRIIKLKEDYESYVRDSKKFKF